MRRVVMLALVVGCMLPAGGCVSWEWLRSVGHFPGIAPSDYAFYSYCGTSSQVFQFPVEQVQGSAVEALLDLGFRELGPAKPCHDLPAALEISALTPDGRPATITFTPQNRMTNMRITIGPTHIGDEMLSRDIFKRVALNFGTIPRDYLPMEPTLANRFNPPVPIRPEHAGQTSETLEGEGFRPGEENLAPAPEFTTPVTGTGSGVFPIPFDPYRMNSSPYYPTLPYPFSPSLPSVPYPEMNPYP
ncbi:MAG: hypothetical protein ACP5XB_05615 [Isosphaeraceae bacterium]